MKIRQGVRGATIGLVALLALRPAAARLDEANQRAEDWTVTEAMIPMRDGVRLHTKIFAPKEHKRPLPFLMHAHALRHRRRPRSGSDAVAEDAGRRRLHLRVPGHPREVRLGGHLRDAAAGARSRATRRRSTRAPTPTTPSSGCSRTCPATTAASACSASPTTAGRRSWARSSRIRRSKAISPQASPADMWLGDDFHHNGAFRLSYGFEYAYDDGEREGRCKQFAFDRYDTYDWYLDARPALERQRAATSTGRSPPGTTSSPIPTTTSSGSARRMIPYIRERQGARR